MSFPKKLKLTAQQKKALKAEQMTHFKEPLRDMSKQDLKDAFGHPTTKRINVSKLIKNIIWQVYTDITLKEREPIEGNIRTLWYKEIKPVLSRAGALKRGEMGYKAMIDMFVRLVMVRGLLSYSDFGFSDERQEDRRIGDKNGHILLVAEKRGQWPWLKRMAEDFDVTVIALGGQPSLLSTEYFVKELKASKVKLKKATPVLTVVDYDPSGDSIERSFIRQLKEFGIKGPIATPLMTPKNLTDEQIELNKYRLSRKKRQRKKVNQWLGRTGGVDGRPFGIEADAMTPEQLTAAFEKQVAKYLKLGVEAVQIRRRKQWMVRLLKLKILQKLGLG